MTIDELARQAGVVVSTVRLYQNRGLLPPPVRQGRVGHYDEGHLTRLRLIAELQGRGFSLAAIKELLDGMDRGESLRAVLGLGETPSTWAPEAPRRMALTELATELPTVELTPAMVERVMALGLVRFSDDGIDVEVRSPSFLEIGRRLADLGVPGDEILDQYEALREDAERIAARFTDLFRSRVWSPFVDEGLPAERLPSLISALEELGPLAEGVVLMALRHALQEQAEAFIRTEADRLGIEIPRPGEHQDTTPAGG